jgi:putative restriction endonuclease
MVSSSHGTAVDSALWEAPHKPLLLLCLLDMAEAGELQLHSFTRTAGLVVRFKTYGALTSDRWPSRLDLRMPFYYPKTQGFWDAFAMDTSQAQSPKSCFVCELHPELFELMADPDFRLKARLLLVSRYFTPQERVALLESLGLCARETRGAAQRKISYAEAEKAGQALNEEAEQEAKKKGRSARFTVQVVSQYKHTCALTGLCCVTSEGCTIVDAAHIESWAGSSNDDIHNGLALSKNAHWAFDEGLWSVRNDGRIILSLHGLHDLKFSTRFACNRKRAIAATGKSVAVELGGVHAAANRKVGNDFAIIGIYDDEFLRLSAANEQATMADIHRHAYWRAAGRDRPFIDDLHRLCVHDRDLVFVH